MHGPENVNNYTVIITLSHTTALQTGRSEIRFPMMSLKFFIDIILPAELWPWD